VRVIFPGIQTRRLGVRGESKYHYVDLALGEEQITSLSSSWQNLGQSMDGRQSAMSNHSNQLDFNNMPRLQADAGFSAVDNSFDANGLFPPTPRGPASQSKTFVYPHSRGMQAGTAEASTYSRMLRFPSSNMPAFSENEPVDLPSIQPYLPPRTDIDTAEALSALYRTHCTSLIDSIRFCKEKQFFRLYMSFHGTLTVPVQKLFTHPNVAPWIEQCDLVMYRTMVRFVSRLTLQAAPVRVINTLSNISASLHDHIAKTFATHPIHVIEAKLKPATVFAGLLYRLIRVNQSAHAAANLLTIDQNREQMWHEWATMVNPKRVMEAELPDCGYEEVHRIMTTEMRNLLEPLQAPALPDDTSLYSFDNDPNVFGSFLAGQSAQSRTGPSQVSTENVLDRWSTFLMSLPGRFPNASARTVLHCISAVGTAALRDITIMSGLSYGHWWVLKIFVDEMALWMAEMGGFLEPSGAGAANAVLNNGSGNGVSAFQSPALDNGNNGTRSNSGSRVGSADHDQSRNPFMTDNTSSTQQQQQLQHYPSQNQHHIQQQQMQQSARQQQQQQQRQQQQQSQTHNFVQQQQQQFQAALQAQQQQQQFPTLNFSSQPILTKQAQQQQEVDIDDSGIGLSLMDDDDVALQELTKFNASASALGHVHHSHHALNALADMSC
jgi:regulatory factor X